MNVKTVSRVAALVTAGVVCLGAWVGCSKGQEGNKKIDVRAMIEQLKSPDKDKRTDACAALGEAGPYAAEAVPALTEALKDPESLVRSLAAYALGQIGPKAAPAIPALKELLNTPDMEVTPSALNAIRAIDPKEAPDIDLRASPPRSEAPAQ
jgi:HEAT repeat protein